MRITYLELLEMIRDNKAPKKIEFNCFTYKWSENGYLSQTNAMCLNGFSDLELATEKLIELIEEEKKIELPSKLELNIKETISEW